MGKQFSHRARNPLAKWFQKQDLTQTQFARQIGVSQGEVSEWLRGKSVPVNHWGRLVKVTGLPVESFFPLDVRRELQERASGS